MLHVIICISNYLNIEQTYFGDNEAKTIYLEHHDGRCEK